MRGRTDLRAFRQGLQQAADAETRRRAFLRPLEHAMLTRAGDRSREDLETELAVCQVSSGAKNSEPADGSNV